MSGRGKRLTSPQYYRGQRYDFACFEPYTRKDGSQTKLVVWMSKCAECGEFFFIKTPLRASKLQPNRRCELHKKPGVRV